MTSVSVQRFVVPSNLSAFTAKRSWSVKQLLSKEAVLPDKVQVGRPVCHGSKVLVNYENSDNGLHSVALLDVESLISNSRDNAVKGVIQLTQHVQDVGWMEACAVAALEDGALQVIAVQEHNIALGQSLRTTHSQPVREIAVKGFNDSIVASGGSDGLLCLTDINALSQLRSAALEHKVIGSVKWTQLNSNVCVSVTTDDGDYYMFDTRSDMSKAAVNVNLIKADLFTHCRYTDHHVLLGYGDGEMKQIDMRKPQNIVCSVTDPYVEGIGGIEFNHASQSFAVSGFTDCSVWKLTDRGDAQLWNHSEQSTMTVKNQDGYACSASFYEHDTMIVTDNHGYLSAYILNWDSSSDY